ncbi:SDR family oxidoreductase [Candidatus Macondimonas diazotrophica]|jgi:nucleoside-diphosphate-sugar epimerase|uniref:SDR family oxidoreductase n=1 Tax=Candidatus Macondimonas diazotrophica TaxID=2305248 RepID=UPI00196BAE01|nr:SDR family oxidoreductase [Candidatus Macondimonas diazotrophica]
MTGVIIAGCGDVGRRLAVRFAERHMPLWGFVQTSMSLAYLRELSMEAVQIDLDRSGALSWPEWMSDSLLYYLIPPPREGQSDPRLQRFLGAIPADRRPRRMIYISTSAVYGDRNGEWVTEETPPAPDTDRGRRRLAAEQMLQSWCENQDVSFVTLRVPGIYGPGRLPVKRLRSGGPLVDERESAYSNRIHVDDLVEVCLAAAERAPDNRIYNVSDGHPTSMTDYMLQIADLLGLEAPPIISMDEAQAMLSPALLSFLNESKRLDNRRMLKELGVRLRYPTLRQGLPACLPEVV